MSSNNGFTPMDDLTFNAYWNERVRPTGEPVAGGERLDPTMVATIERLTDFGNASPPASSRERVRDAVRANVQSELIKQKETEMLATSALERATIPLFPERAGTIASPRSRRPSLSRRWLLAQAAVAAILILALLGGWFIYQQRDDHPAVAPVASPEATATTDKEQYRYGPNRAGVSPSGGPIGNPVELWRTQMNGPISAEAAIVDGTVFVGAMDGTFYALDATTGQVRWQFAGGAAFSGTPSVVDGIVFAVNDDGNLYALDATTGTERWRAEGSRQGASPVVVGGTLYIGSADGTLFARDVATGTELWSVPLGEAAGRSTSVANELVYVGSADTVLHAFDIATGEEQWTYQGISGIVGTPVIVDGVVYQTIFSGDNILVALDAATGEERWRFQNADAEKMWVPAVDGGRVFSGSDDGSMYALDASTGDVLWHFETDGIIYAAPTIAGGMLYFASHDGFLYGVDPNSGAELFKAPVGAQVDFGPAVVDGVAYLGTMDGAFLAIGGSDHPAIAAPGNMAGTPEVPAATAEASPIEGAASEPAQLLWSLDRDSGIFRTPGALSLDPMGNLWVFDGPNTIYILDPDGTLIETWQDESFNFTQADGDVFGGAVFADNGDFYILNSGNYEVLTFDANRVLLSSWGGFGNGDGEFRSPLGIAMAANGNLFVSDDVQNRLQEFNPDGTFVAGWPTGPSPFPVIVGPDGIVYASSNCDLIGWNAGGEEVLRWTTYDDAAACDWVGGIAIDQNGNVFASVASRPYDANQAGIIAFGPDGDTIAKWNPRIDPSVTLDFDTQFVLDEAGNIYVLDFYPHTVSKFQLLAPLAPEATPTA